MLTILVLSFLLSVVVVVNARMHTCVRVGYILALSLSFLIYVVVVVNASIHVCLRVDYAS